MALFLIEELTCVTEEVVNSLGSAVDDLEGIVEDMTDELRSKWGAIEGEYEILKASEARLKEMLEAMAAEE